MPHLVLACVMAVIGGGSTPQSVSTQPVPIGYEPLEPTIRTYDAFHQKRIRADLFYGQATPGQPLKASITNAVFAYDLALGQRELHDLKEGLCLSLGDPRKHWYFLADVLTIDGPCSLEMQGAMWPTSCVFCARKLVIGPWGGMVVRHANVPTPYWRPQKVIFVYDKLMFSDSVPNSVNISSDEALQDNPAMRHDLVMHTSAKRSETLLDSVSEYVKGQDWQSLRGEQLSEVTRIADEIGSSVSPKSFIRQYDQADMPGDSIKLQDQTIFALKGAVMFNERALPLRGKMDGDSKIRLIEGIQNGSNEVPAEIYGRWLIELLKRVICEIQDAKLNGDSTRITAGVECIQSYVHPPIPLLTNHHQEYLKVLAEARQLAEQVEHPAAPPSPAPLPPTTSTAANEPTPPKTVVEALTMLLWTALWGRCLLGIIALLMAVFAIWTSLPDDAKSRVLNRLSGKSKKSGRKPRVRRGA